LRGKGDQAEALVRAAIEKSPSIPELWHLLGFIQGDRGNWAGAVQQLSRPVAPLALPLHVALLKAGRLDEYRRYRHEALLRGSVERSLLLLPVDGADLELLRRLPAAPPSDTAPRQKAVIHARQGLMEYRRGDFQAAYRWTGGALADHHDVQ